MCVCVCLRYTDKCKLCILAVLCTSVLQCGPGCVFVGEMDGVLQHFLSHSIQLDRMY